MRRFALIATMLISAAATAHADSAARTHDGFHFQVAGGLGYYNVSNEVQPFSGVTIPMQLFLGGTLMDGLAFGGGLMFDYSPSPSTDVQGVSSQTVLGIGLYGDYYLDPKANGLHIQGFLAGAVSRRRSWATSAAAIRPAS